MITTARRNSERVGAYMIDDLWQTEGVNDRVQLARMNGEMNRRIVEKWMRSGVTVQDPSSTELEPMKTCLPSVLRCFCSPS